MTKEKGRNDATRSSPDTADAKLILPGMKTAIDACFVKSPGNPPQWQSRSKTGWDHVPGPKADDDDSPF